MMLSHCAAALLTMLACSASGCVPDTDKEEAKPPELDDCTLKVSACNTECHKADALKECPSCCFENGKSCDIGRS